MPSNFVNLNSASFSQYQSEDSSTRLRKRSSLRRSASSACLRAEMSCTTATSCSGSPEGPRATEMVSPTHTAVPSLRR
ncbi:MAG: hypothetical protein A3D95_13240 [Betaproteobacteria bacterium RIFCSPHIGHO2_12_FULL_69_13]|nr:MAG: hypothetical protein A3D95_13240 [Betaproteobacteria bacterium RIFCSPHIGHO2_12_FULL_69_13]